MRNGDSSASPGEQAQVDVRAIEHELAELWRHAAEGDGDRRRAVTRACALNLVVVVGTLRAAQQATETIVTLTGRYPNRAIVVSAASEVRDGEMDAWVQAHCQITGPDRPQVCCEQVTIVARGDDAVARVPGTVLPLLVPDVPVMLWWPRGEPFDHPLFARLTGVADRVIVDTATFAAPEAGLARLASMATMKWTIGDLMWGRLTPWRELIAQCFDAPATLPYLAEIRHVTVEYEARPNGDAGRSQALLMIGWLASRLGWRTQDQAGAPGFIDAAGAEVLIDLRPAAPRDDALDRLVAVRLEGPQSRFVVMGDGPDGAVARSEVPGLRPLRRRVRLDRLAEAELLAEELQLLGRDRTFEDALRIAASLV